MLKSIRLQNFFGFQDCTINLEKGANVLVGINGSGKSNFFKAVKLLTALVYDNELKNILYKDFGGIENVLFADKNKSILKSFSINARFDITVASQINTDFEISISRDFSGGHLIEKEDYAVIKAAENFVLQKIHREYEAIEIQKRHSGRNESFGPYQIPQNTSILNLGNGELRLTNNDVSTFRFEQYLLQYKLYTGFNTSRDSLLRTPNPPSLDKSLMADVSNLASLLNDLKLTDKETYNRIVNALKSVNDKFIGIEFKQLSGFIEMWLEEDGLNRAISPIHISDGTLKFLCLMAILYNPNRGSVVCIDEPELGLHPDMINTLHEAIEFAAETSQVIISTHSAHLLNYFDLEQVRVFEKDENNATVVEQYSKSDFEGWQQKFQTGKMWREGDIGGKRW